MDLTADPGLSIVAFSAPAGSSADEGLRILASWAATQGAVEAASDERQT